MMKFFRKHNKKLLAVFMVLLMIVFLGGSALDSMLRPSGDRIVAHSRLGDLSRKHHQRAKYTTDILDRTGFSWRRPFYGLAEPIDETDWILLTREAEKLGLAPNTAAARTMLRDDPNIVEQARFLRVKPDHILQARAEFVAIQQTAQIVANAATPSEAEILSAARNFLEKVRIGTVLLPAAAFVDDAEEFTEAQIGAQFTAYREREHGQGIDFGYYVPPAVKVQYIKIDGDVIAKSVRIANLERKAKAYFDEQRETDQAFRRPKEEAANDEDEPIEGPPDPPKPPYLTWEEAREAATDVVREQEAEAAAERLADWLVQYTAEPWLDATRGEDLYKAVPEGVGELAYYDGIDGILTKIPRTLAYPEAVSTGVTDFFSEDEAFAVEELGQAHFRPERGRWETLQTLSFRSQAVIPTIPTAKGVNLADYLADFQTCRYPLTDSDGDIYVLRVVDARAGHVPESVDEVREEVLSDLRLMERYETAKARAESLRSCAESMTLVEAYESDDELVTLKDTEAGLGSGYFDPPPFSRPSDRQAFSGAATGKTFIAGGVGQVPNEIVEACFALADADNKTEVFELPDRATVMIVEWMDTEQAGAEEFEEMRENLVRQITLSRMQDMLKDWLSSEQIRARNGFEIALD